MAFYFEHVKARQRPASVLVLALALITCFSTCAFPATPEAPDVRITLTKDACWYEPGAKAGLSVTLVNRGRQAIEDVSIRARVHSPNSTRGDLDAALEGKPRRSYRFTETLERDITLEPGTTGFRLQLDIPKRSGDGVYPLTVEAVRYGSALASTVNQLVVMSVRSIQAFPPLNLSIVFDMLEPPHRNPDGSFKNGSLAAECAGGEEPGWFTTVLSQTEKRAGLRASYSLSPMLLDEMVDFSNGCVIKAARGKERTVRPESRAAANVSAVVDGFKKMALDPRFQFLLTPYASPDLERLGAMGWYRDARKQISRGHNILERELGTPMSREYLYPPGLKWNSKVQDALGGEAGRFLLLDPSLLERSRAGRKVTGGLTPGSPVYTGKTEEGQALALFADRRLMSLAQRLKKSSDGHYVAQSIISELTNLFLERPARRRSCLLVWPSWWRPDRRVVDQVFDALAGAPWLQSVTVGESLLTAPALEDVLLEIPPAGVSSDGYMAKVRVARSLYYNFVRLLPGDSDLRAALQQDLFISQSDVWRQWGLESAGLKYADRVKRTIKGELAKITMPAEGSITLTSSKADIPITVMNGTGYRVRARLSWSSDGLSFPEGSGRSVVLEPKENLFEIPVKVRKSGKVRLSVTLRGGGLTLSGLQITVVTGRFNTFAVMLVGVLLAMIMITWAVRLSVRRRTGKHKKKRERGRGAAEEAEEQA